MGSALRVLFTFTKNMKNCTCIPIDIPWKAIFLFSLLYYSPSTAKLLATYIVNLILVLYGIFADTLPSEPPRELSNGVILEVVEHHKISLRNNSLDDIDQATDFAQHPEWVIQSEISKRLPVPLPPVPDDRESGDQVAM